MTVAVSAPTSLTVVPAPTPGERPQWVTDAPLMTWQTLPNTKMNTVMIDPAGRSLTRALGWCGGALKFAGSEIFVATGGHADGCSNSIYSIRLADTSPQWVRRNEPTMTGLTVDAPYYEDGRPAARHTYWNIQFNQSRNLLMFFGSAAVWGSGGANFRNVDAFDPVANDYLPAGSFPDCSVPMNVDRPIAMDPLDNCYHQGNEGNATLSRWDNTTNSWSNLPGPRAVFGAGPALVHDPARNRFTRFDRYRARVISLPSWTESAGPNYSGPTAAKVREKCSAIYVPAIGGALDDKYVVTEFGARLLGEPVQMHVVDPDSFAVTVAPLDGTPPTLSQGGVGHTYGRLMYVPELKIIALVASEAKDVYFVRLA